MYVIETHLYKMFHHTLLPNVSIAFAIIIGVALQKYKEYKNLPYRILGTTQCSVLSVEYFHLHTFAVYSLYSCNATQMVMTKVIETC
jgi:hypothetical protein